MKKEKLTSKEIGRRLALHALRLLAEAQGNFMYSKDVIEKLEKYVPQLAPKADYPNLYETYGSGKYPRWFMYLHFHSIDFVKAKMLRREKRIWYLEEEGKKRLSGGESDESIISYANKRYWSWKRARDEAEKQALAKKQEAKTPPDEAADVEEAAEEGMEKAALDDMQNHINKIDPYEYQNLVAALLRGMGYFVSEVAGKGADGGVDIVAYRDPLGAEEPRLKVQVKKQESPVGDKVITELHGNLTEGEIGVVVSNSGFSKPARDRARNVLKHMRLIDNHEFLQLWQKHYSGMDEQERLKMPLKQIYVLDSDRIMDE